MSYGEHLLERFLKLMVPYPFIRNYRPNWLLGLELDFFFPSHNSAIEFQGDQHYRPVNFSGVSSDLNSIKRRDSLKRKICSKNAVVLIRIDAVDLFTARLKHKLKKCRKVSSPSLTRSRMSELRKLDKEAAAYRRVLVNKFNSISAISRKRRF